MSTLAEALSAVAADAAVPRDDVRRWIDSGDLMTWGVVWSLLQQEPPRVEPELTPDEQVDFMRRYLLRCIDASPAPGEHLHGGYAAAWELASALKQWRRRDARIAATVRGVALELEKMYRRGDPSTRNRILCGVLEHAFEDPALRPYFSSWERDAELREAYRLAVEWGTAHEE